MLKFKNMEETLVKCLSQDRPWFFIIIIDLS